MSTGRGNLYGYSHETADVDRNSCFHGRRQAISAQRSPASSPPANLRGYACVRQQAKTAQSVSLNCLQTTTINRESPWKARSVLHARRRNHSPIFIAMAKMAAVSANGAEIATKRRSPENLFQQRNRLKSRKLPTAKWLENRS